MVCLFVHPLCLSTAHCWPRSTFYMSALFQCHRMAPWACLLTCMPCVCAATCQPGHACSRACQVPVLPLGRTARLVRMLVAPLLGGLSTPASALLCAGLGMPLSMPTMPQDCQAVARAWRFAYLPYRYATTWQPECVCLHTCCFPMQWPVHVSLHICTFQFCNTSSLGTPVCTPVVSQCQHMVA